MKKTCFGFINGGCIVKKDEFQETDEQKETICVNCPFYKTKTELEEDMNNSFRRINTLSNEAQQAIADKHYFGTMPWRTIR